MPKKSSIYVKNAFKQCVIESDYKTNLFLTAGGNDGRQLRKCDSMKKLSNSSSVALSLGNRIASISDGTGEGGNK